MRAWSGGRGVSTAGRWWCSSQGGCKQRSALGRGFALTAGLLGVQHASVLGVIDALVLGPCAPQQEGKTDAKCEAIDELRAWQRRSWVGHGQGAERLCDAIGPRIDLNGCMHGWTFVW